MATRKESAGTVGDDDSLRTVKLRQLEVFHAIMTSGSVTGAAKLLYVSQPAVTSLLRYMEAQLGFRLFDRIKGRLYPTDEAQALFAEVDRVFESVRAVRNLAVDLRDTRRGVLSIAASPSLGVVAIARVLRNFLEFRPEIRVRLQVYRKAEVIDMVARQIVDLGLTYLSVDHPNIDIVNLARGNLLCAMPANHPLAAQEEVRVKDLAGVPMITYTHTQGLSSLIDSAFAESKVVPRTVVEVALVSTAWSLVQEGVGVALVDPFSDLDSVFKGVVLRPFIPTRTISLELLRPARKPLSVLAESFVEEVRRKFSGATTRVSARRADARTDEAKFLSKNERIESC